MSVYLYVVVGRPGCCHRRKGGWIAGRQDGGINLLNGSDEDSEEKG